MSIRIGFIHSLSEDAAEEWLLHLRETIGQYDLRLIDQFNASELRDINIAIAANPDPAEFLKLPNLQWVQSLWAGVENLIADVPERVSITRLVDPELARTMAEAVLMASLYLHRKMHLYRNQQIDKCWTQHPVLPASEVTIGVLGVGHLGQGAAQRLTDNGFDVIGWKREKSLNSKIQTYYGALGLERLLKRSDILVILLPLTPETYHLIDEEKLASMKRGASIINFARAQIIEQAALMSSLSKQHIEHAILDVFETEPLSATNPMWSNPNVTILPHIAAPTHKGSASDIVAKNMSEFVQTGKFPEGTVEVSRGY